MRILIVAGNISRQMGGEAVLPYHYIRELSARGVSIDAITHARVRDEVLKSDIADKARFHFIEDANIEKALHWLGQRAPAQLRDVLFNSLIGLNSASRLAQVARRLDGETSYDIIHEPIPVSPLTPSFLTKMRAPVIIGPMNGAMSFPPALAADYARGSELVVNISRAFARVANILLPGKKQAARLLVANKRTERGLPDGISHAHTEVLVENGVDLSLWQSKPAPPSTPTFVYVGRLVWWKAVDILIDAIAKTKAPARLLIIGDGADRAALEAQANAVAPDRIDFAGFLPQTEIAERLTTSTGLVLSSLRECGGAVVLEAFAAGKPAIASDWGGPQDYITPETGMLIAPKSRAAMVDGFAAAMEKLAEDPDKTAAMGAAARAHVEAHFSWSAKADRIMEIYKQTTQGL